ATDGIVASTVEVPAAFPAAVSGLAIMHPRSGPAHTCCIARPDTGLDLQARVLEVEVALDAVHRLVVDPPLAAQLDDRLALGVQDLSPQPLPGQRLLLDAAVVVAVEAGGEAAPAELVLSAHPLQAGLAHPLLPRQLLEPGERR